MDEYAPLLKNKIKPSLILQYLHKRFSRFINLLNFQQPLIKVERDTFPKLSWPPTSQRYENNFFWIIKGKLEDQQKSNKILPPPKNYEHRFTRVNGRGRERRERWQYIDPKQINHHLLLQNHYYGLSDLSHHHEFFEMHSQLLQLNLHTRKFSSETWNIYCSNERKRSIESIREADDIAASRSKLSRTAVIWFGDIWTTNRCGNIRVCHYIRSMNIRYHCTISHWQWRWWLSCQHGSMRSFPLKPKILWIGGNLQLHNIRSATSPQIIFAKTAIQGDSEPCLYEKRSDVRVISFLLYQELPYPKALFYGTKEWSIPLEKKIFKKNDRNDSIALEKFERHLSQLFQMPPHKLVFQPEKLLADLPPLYTFCKAIISSLRDLKLNSPG